MKPCKIILLVLIILQFESSKAQILVGKSLKEVESIIDKHHGLAMKKFDSNGNIILNLLISNLDCTFDGMDNRNCYFNSNNICEKQIFKPTFENLRFLERTVSKIKDDKHFVKLPNSFVFVNELKHYSVFFDVHQPQNSFSMIIQKYH